MFTSPLGSMVYFIFVTPMFLEIAFLFSAFFPTHSFFLPNKK